MLKLRLESPKSSLILASVVIMATFLLVACGTRGDSEPVATATATAILSDSSDTPSPVSPEGDATATPTSTPVVRPTPISDEELEKILDRVGFFLFQWESTDFSIHSVPLTEIRKGGPGKDDITPIDDPQFESIKAANGWLKDSEPVQVVDINGDVRAYPQQVLIWHEVVNDVVGGEPVLVTF